MSELLSAFGETFHTNDTRATVFPFNLQVKVLVYFFNRSDNAWTAETHGAPSTHYMTAKSRTKAGTLPPAAHRLFTFILHCYASARPHAVLLIICRWRVVGPPL